MYKYYVDYISSTDHDICHVWTMADSASQAESDVRSEYWDIEEIVDVRRA